LRQASQWFKRHADGNSQSDVYQWLQICTESALDKAKALYRKVDDSPTYYTACVIDLNNSDADDNDDSLGVGAYMNTTYNSASNWKVDAFEECISAVQEDFEMTE
jgi:hypothetical protein